MDLTMKLKSFLCFILSFMFLGAYAQESQVFKSKDTKSGLVNVLTVTKNSDGSILINRSTETNTEGEEVAAYNLAVLSHETDYYWIIPFDEGEAARGSGPVTISCNCMAAGDEDSSGEDCAEEFNVYTGKATCRATACRNCNMVITASSKNYPNAGGYLIIEATSVTIE
jgi:hypothetical protein